MDDFEVRIFANIAGIAEINFGNSTALSGNIISADIIDAKRNVFSQGTFIVFYGKEAYVYVKLIGAPAEADFRDSQVYVCIAVRRNYKLNEAKSVLDNLGDEFFMMASRARSEVAGALQSNRISLYEMVGKCIEYDPDQQSFQLSSKEAVISYEKKEELEALLSTPVRPEFSGIKALYILSKDEASRKWPELKNLGFKAIADISYQYQRTYTLRYPDGNEEIIAGLEQEIYRECYKQYYKPLTLKGKLLDHIQDWGISLNEEKTVYTIGIQFAPEEKIVAIESREESGNDCTQQVKYFIAKGQGKIENDSLILVGTQISDLNNIKLGIENNQEWKIIEQKVCADKISIMLRKINYYDVTNLWRYVAAYVGRDENVAITLIDARTGKELHAFSSRNLSEYIDIPYADVLYRVKTEKYEQCDLKINSDGQPEGKYSPSPKIKKTTYPQDAAKSGVSVTFELPEFGRGKKKISLTIKKHSDRSEKTIPITERQRTIKCSYDCYSFTINVDGYDPFMVEKDYSKGDMSSDRIYVDIVKKINKYQIKAILLVLLSIIMFGGGFLTSSLISLRGRRDGQTKIESLEAENRDLHESVDSLASLNIQLDIDNKSKRDSIKNVIMSKQRQEAKEEKLRKINELKKQRMKLVEKLKGTSFTPEDIDRFESLGNLSRGEEELVKSCEACFRLLNAPVEEKQNMAEKIKNESSWEYKNLYEVLIKEHKEVMREIILEKEEGYAEVYKTDKTNNAKSIDDTILNYNNGIDE